MAINGQSCIFRVTSAGQTENTVTDKIDFEVTAVPDNASHINDSEIDLTRAIAVNTKPKGNFNELQDTSADALTVIITGAFKFPTDTGLVTAYKAKQWLIEAQTNADFPKGRFGLRLNDFPGFNLTPNSSRGYLLSNFKFLRQGEWVGRLGFIAILRFNGNEGSPNGSGQYIW